MLRTGWADLLRDDMRYIVLSFVFFGLTGAMAFGQSCDQSFAVKADKSVVTFDWLIDGNKSGLTVLSCPIAERIRTELFLSDVGSINLETFKDVQSLKAAATARRAELVKERGALKAALDANTATKQLVEVALLQTEKFLALLCLAPEPTSKAICTVELGLVVKDYFDFVKGAQDKVEMHKRLTLIDQQIENADKEFQQLMKLTSAAGLPASLQRRKEMYDKLCLTIRQSCL